MKYSKLISLFVAALAFVACGGDDDEPEVRTATSATAEYVVNLSQDLLDAANVTIYYIDSNGQQAQEIVTSTTWTKTVRFASLPANAGFSVQPVLKGGPTREEYTIEATGQMTITILDQHASTLGEPLVSKKEEVKGVLGSDYLGQYLTRIAVNLQQAKAIAADGTVSDIIIEWGGNADNDDPNRDTEVTSEGATGTTRAAIAR